MRIPGYWKRVRCSDCALLSLLVLISAPPNRTAAHEQKTELNPADRGKFARVKPPNPLEERMEKEEGAAHWHWSPVIPDRYLQMNSIAFGDGRGDGRVRLYVTTHNWPYPETIFAMMELTYGDCTSGCILGSPFGPTSLIDLPFNTSNTLLLTDGRGDGTPRLYVGDTSPSGNTLELTWNGDPWSWITTSMGPAGQSLYGGAAAGDARGDGRPHLYFAMSYPPANIFREYTFTGADWTSVSVPSPVGGFSSGAGGIVVGDGRNDAVLRIYQGLFQWIGTEFRFHVFEFSWNGASWDAVRLNREPLGGVGKIVVADGRNDGVNRVYFVDNSVLQEYSFNGDSWELSAGPVFAGNFVIGDGRNDGTNRLYFGDPHSGLQMIEATFDGTTWQTSGSIYLPCAYSNGIVMMGDARGDGVNRIFTLGDCGLYDLTYSR